MKWRTFGRSQPEQGQVIIAQGVCDGAYHYAVGRYHRSLNHVVRLLNDRDERFSVFVRGDKWAPLPEFPPDDD